MPEPILLNHYVHTNEDEPLEDKVKLLQVYPQYTHIQYKDGRETTVSLFHLAPFVEDTFYPNNILCEHNIEVDSRR